VFAAYDHIAANPDTRDELEQCLGIKYDPHGLLHDQHIRTFYKPVDHMLRDWQHTLVGGGVANVEIARLISALTGHGIGLALIGDFLETFKLPKRLGKVDRLWLSKKRLGKKMKSLSSFSSVLLCLVQILATFVVETIGPAHDLCDHANCFWKLHLIIGILSMGPSMAMPHVDRLRQLIREHAELFSRLYPDHVKPKFHHLFHIPENMLFLRKLLSCFVTERKHRATKRCALFVFRHIDNVVVKEMLSRQCESIASCSESLFFREYLISPKVFNFAGTLLNRARSAVMPCGMVAAGDLVWFTCDGSVGVALVIWFWSHGSDAHINVQMEKYNRLCPSGTRWGKGAPLAMFVDTDSIVSAVMHAEFDDDVILVIPPVSSYL
jgi:hypothetical protein